MAALFTMAAAALLVAPGAEAASAVGTINTPSNGPQLVWSVEAAGFPYHSTQSVANGAGVRILCQTLGEHIVGTHGDSNVWDFLNNAGMVPHTNVDYGTPWIERIPGVPAGGPAVENGYISKDDALPVQFVDQLIERHHVRGS